MLFTEPASFQLYFTLKDSFQIFFVMITDDKIESTKPLRSDTWQYLTFELAVRA